MPGKPEDRRPEDETENIERPTLTDRLNKYLLCAYLDRLNEEDAAAAGEEDAAVVDVDSEETFSD